MEKLITAKFWLIIQQNEKQPRDRWRLSFNHLLSNFYGTSMHQARLNKYTGQRENGGKHKRDNAMTGRLNGHQGFIRLAVNVGNSSSAAARIFPTKGYHR